MEVYMILFSGDKDLYDFIYNIDTDISSEISISEAQKLIVSDYSLNAISLIRQADELNIPVLGILDGYQSVAEAFGADCIPLENCAEGKKELAILDTSIELFKGMAHVTSICRGNPYQIDEERIPPELDCVSRAETGEIIAFCKKNTLGKPAIFAVNYYLNSSLTENGDKIIYNFLNI